MQAGWTGLMWDSDKGYRDVVEVLLEAKADSNITNEVEFGVCADNSMLCI